jgi:16S rRNA G527 N7-methylase RsmG
MFLLERRGGRASFLRREVAALELENVTVLEGDAKDFGRDPALAGRFDRVLLKAVAPPIEALELARAFLGKGGAAALFQSTGWRAQDHLESEGWTLVDVVSLEPFVKTAVFFFEPS